MGYRSSQYVTVFVPNWGVRKKVDTTLELGDVIAPRDGVSIHGSQLLLEDLGVQTGVRSVLGLQFLPHDLVQLLVCGNVSMFL